MHLARDGGRRVVRELARVERYDHTSDRSGLAAVQPHFSGGDLDGLKLIGFSIWERRGGTSRNVTFPARQYSVNGERRAFALLRPILDAAAQDRVRDTILAAYAAFEQEVAKAS